MATLKQENQIILNLINLFPDNELTLEQARAIDEAKDYLKIAPAIFKYEGHYEEASFDLVQSVMKFEKETRLARVNLTKALVANLNDNLVS